MQAQIGQGERSILQSLVAFLVPLVLMAREGWQPPDNYRLPENLLAYITPTNVDEIISAVGDGVRTKSFGIFTAVRLATLPSGIREEDVALAFTITAVRGVTANCPTRHLIVFTDGQVMITDE